MLCEVGACPKGHYDNPKGLSPENMLAYRFHQECKAVRNWPNDPIVRRNAVIIEEVLSHV